MQSKVWVQQARSGHVEELPLDTPFRVRNGAVKSLKTLEEAKVGEDGEIHDNGWRSVTVVDPPPVFVLTVEVRARPGWPGRSIEADVGAAIRERIGKEDSGINDFQIRSIEEKR